MSMEVQISESQLKLLVEKQEQLKLDFTQDVKINPINKRCKVAISKKFMDSPWCKLDRMYKEKLTDELRLRVDSAISQLLNVYKRYLDTGILPRIIELSLMDENRTVNDLELISDYLSNPKFSQDDIKKKLLSLKTVDVMPSKEELDTLLMRARNKEYTDYENSLIGDQFDLQRKSLRINYRCEKDMDEKFFDLIKKVKVDKKDVVDFVERFIKCLETSMKSTNNPIKSDVLLKTNLFVLDNGNKKQVLESGNYEVKKIDPLVDSYLSEFFSIFKETKIAPEKSEYLELYNKIIQVVYEWMKVNGQEYLENVKKGMKGIIFSDYMIVPIKYIDLYWSNKGRGGCDEKRLSIRYKLKPDVNTNSVEVYKYTLGSDIVEEVKNFNFKLNQLSSKEEVCL